MPVPNPKNYWSQAAADLNVDDQLKSMLADAEEQRRKRLQQGLGPLGYGGQGMGTAASELLGGGMGLGAMR